MSFQPRTSPARRRLLREGRARVAVIVSTATVLGGLTGALPALAGSAPTEAVLAACAEPTRTGPTVVVDGEEVTCPVPDEAPAATEAADPKPAKASAKAAPDPDPATTTTKAAPDPAPAVSEPAPAAASDTAADDAAPAPPADATTPEGTTSPPATTTTETGTTTAPEPPPAPTTTTAPEPPPAPTTTPPPALADAPALTESPGPAPVQPAPAASEPPPAASAPTSLPADVAAIIAAAPPISPRPKGSLTAALTAAPAITKEPARASRTPKRAKATRAPATAPRRTARRTSDVPPTDATVAPAEGSGQAPSAEATSYAALPASWTSLAPLDLSIDTIDGFPIPPFLLPIYQAAGAQFGVPWQVLASINEIETDFGRNAGVSSAGALGWMQFIKSSWERWGTDGDGDGRRDPRNPVDAIFAAARYLRDAGAGEDLPKAVFAYNHADWYVNKVVKRAREFAGLDETLVSALSERALTRDLPMYRAAGNPFAGPGAIAPSPGQALLLSKKQLTRMVLTSKDIDVYAGGRKDIAEGRVDRRVLATLVFLARSGKKPTVSSLVSGHGLRTASGNISAHSYGAAVDIAAVNGTPISGNQGADSLTSDTLDRLVQLQGFTRPNQIISLMTVDGQDNTLAMGDHADHIHVGFPKQARVPDDARPDDVKELIASLRTMERPAAREQ